MGYRWYKGRFINDEEYAQEQDREAEELVNGLAFGVPAIGLGIVGYLVFGGFATVLFGIGGLVLAFVFPGIFRGLAIFLLHSVRILLFVITAAVVLWVLWMFFH